MQIKNRVFITGLLAIIMGLSSGLFLQWENHTIDGAVWQLEQKGFIVHRADNNQLLENSNLSQFQIRYFQDFKYYNKANFPIIIDENHSVGYSINTGFTYVIYWEPHYADSYPFYEIWFCNESINFVYTFNEDIGLIFG